MPAAGARTRFRPSIPETTTRPSSGIFPAPMSHASAVALGGRVYVLGGSVHGLPTNRILAFDPSGRGVRTAGRLPVAVSNAAAATVGGTAYLIGGVGAGGKTLDSIVTVRLRSR